MNASCYELENSPNKKYIAPIGEGVAAQAVITHQAVITQLESEIKNKIRIIELNDLDYMMGGYIMAVVKCPDTYDAPGDGPGDACDEEVANIFTTFNLMLKNMTPQEIRNNLTSVLYYFLNQNQNQNLAKLLEIAQARAKVLDEASKKDDLLNKFIELMHLLIR